MSKMPAPLRTQSSRVAFPLVAASPSSPSRTPLTCWTHLTSVFVTVSAFVALVVVFNDGILVSGGADAVVEDCRQREAFDARPSLAKIKLVSAVYFSGRTVKWDEFFFQLFFSQ